MNKAWAFGLLLCMCVVPTAKTQEQAANLWDSGNAFLSICGDVLDGKQPTVEMGECLGYVRGVDAGLILAADTEGRDDLFYCAPDDVTNGQMIRILIKFIKDHPEKDHLRTRKLELDALMDAFPCKKGRKE